MASRCCGNRLSLPNQYDTKTPRASLSLAAARRPRYFTAVRRPPGILPGTVSRHESHAQRGSRNVLGEISQISAKKISTKSSELSDRRTLPSEPRPSLENVTPRGQAASRPQVQVLCGTSCLDFRRSSRARIGMTHSWRNATTGSTLIAPAREGSTPPPPRVQTQSYSDKRFLGRSAWFGRAASQTLGVAPNAKSAPTATPINANFSPWRGPCPSPAADLRRRRPDADFVRALRH